MPLFEFKCTKHGVFERITSVSTKTAQCPKCEKSADKVEFSVPAQRNPEYGIQR